MPPASTAPGPHFDELTDELRRRGLRVTWGRLAILELLRSATEPLSSDEIAARLASNQRDRATLYHNLKALEIGGLVHRLEVDRVIRFAAARDLSVASSTLFVCSRCGKVERLDNVCFGVAERPPRAIATKRFELRVHGTCDDCWDIG